MGLRLRDVYRSLASLQRAGLVTSEALRQLRSNGTLPDPLGASVQQAVEAGEPLSAALARHRDAIPDEDVALIEAGEITGRLEENLERLAVLREDRQDARRRLITESWYPILLAHFAALLMPLASLAVKGRFSTGAWLARVLLILGPAYAIVFLFARLGRSAVWRERFRNVVDALPGFGSAARHRRRALFATVLEAAYQAGVPVEQSLRVAAHAAREPQAERAAQAVSSGQKLTQGLLQTGIFPSAALSRIASGEESGEISQALLSIAADENEQAQAIFRRAMVTLGQFIALAVMLWIAWFVISFYLGLYAPYLD